MDRSQNQGGTPPNDHTHYNEEENMDRAAQSGVEGAFGANPDAERTREQMRQDAEDAFGGTGEQATSTAPSGSTSDL